MVFGASLRERVRRLCPAAASATIRVDRRRRCDATASPLRARGTLERSSPADLNVAPNPANFVGETFDLPAKLVDRPVEAFVDVLLRDLLFRLVQKALCA